MYVFRLPDIIRGNICRFLFDRSIADAFFCFFYARHVILCVGNKRFDPKHICAGQFLYIFRDDLRIAFVDVSDSIVFVGSAEVNDQTLAFPIASTTIRAVEFNESLLVPVTVVTPFESALP